MVLLLLACVAGPSTRAALPDPGRPNPGDSGPPPVDDTGPGPVDSGTPATDHPPDDTAAGPACGDGACDADEGCWDCAADCGSCDCPTPVEVVVYLHPGRVEPARRRLPRRPLPLRRLLRLHPRLRRPQDRPPRRRRAGGDARPRGPRLHAMAEVHWSSWADEPGDWYDKGVELRRRMEAAGYDVDAGDTWAVNELPSSVRSEPDVREAVVDLLHGLHDGPEGATPATGVVFIVGMGHGTMNVSEYEPLLKDWLEDADFWAAVNPYARHWAQAVYADPDWSCVDGTTTAERSAAVNAYVQHVTRLADAGPDAVNTAQGYLNRAYVPLMNAVWKAREGDGDTDVPLDTMKHHVSTEVYAARAWSADHASPDGRLGFAWDQQDGVERAELEELAARLASAIHHAYDEGGGAASGACSPSGAYTWCQCAVDGASFNDAWDTFADW